MMKYESPLINGDGTYSRDFTYIDNVVQANQLAAVADKPEALNTVYNVAYGERTSLNELFYALRESLSRFDRKIASVEPEYGPFRVGDIPHSLADIGKAVSLLGYKPEYSALAGISAATEWYWNNLSV